MARLFDQTNPDYIEVGDVPSVDIDGDQITVSAWLKLDTANGEQKLVSKWADVGQKFQYLMSITDEEKLQFVVQTLPITGVKVARGTTTISTGSWHHLSGCYDGSDVFCYLDGIQDGSVSASGNLDNTNAPLVLGAGSSGAGSEQPLDGYLGHCAIWDIALSDSQINSLAKGISPLQMRRENLVFYAPLNGQSPELDVIEGLDLTLFGTSKVEEPPIPNSIVAP